MIQRMIEFSLKNRGLVLLTYLVLAAWGYWALLRTPISLARSEDDGKTWNKVADLETEPGEYSYPAIIQSAAGTLEISYTWKRTHIKHVSVDPKTLRK